MPPIYRCPNYDYCGHHVEKPFKLCDECRAAARRLNKNLQHKTDEEILDELEHKPRSWRDVFR